MELKSIMPPFLCRTKLYEKKFKIIYIFCQENYLTNLPTQTIT